ncbi:MAG: flagellar hook assembly protein FlgD [Methylocystis sp.]
MQVTPATAITTNTASTKSAASSGSNTTTIDYNSFLQLLVTEMQNQDPTQPMDPTQTVTQLATFSGVEQAVQTNSILSSLLSNSSLSQASSLIGHTVTSADGSTTGVIQSVSLTSAGMTATLANGGTVTLTSGITIS